MAGPVRRRQACDRCHSQKLRCPKQQGSASCTRCAKMKAPCVFSTIGRHSSGHVAAAAVDAASLFPSPPSSSLSPSGAATALQPQPWADIAEFPSGGFGGYYIGHPAGMLSLPGVAPVPDWLALDAALASSSSESPHVVAATAGGGSSASSFGDQSAAEAEAACGRTLAELQVELDGTLAALPPPPFMHVAAGDNAAIAERLAEVAARLAARGFLERIFAAVQRLTDVYPAAVDAALGGGGGGEPPCTVPDCVHAHGLPPEFAGLDDGHDGAPPLPPRSGGGGGVDMALAGQLVSCHLRLLDVLDRIMLYALSCLRLKVAAGGVRHPDFPLPELKVGSFRPAGPSAQLMQVILIRDMMDGLHQHLRLFADAVDAEASAAPSLGARTLKLQTELLGERQARVSKHCKSLSSFLFNRDPEERP
ncbi:hypothetical protein GGTG_00937 [Gaeumannomyces tritici R3-111a-1]|uniref:Zn(2)-C6 fungal-type domain-containing protein n=1 Tax=Gaeumannomyces tritici (strain R3-111a-1) TaxID=644352 RepID=J3NI54_GAET3|nr:hypothetical protein GGTG_00937 [Gaeumannomyces tritici R3-111a-1]EJT80947.1 hypothetical protein GGTG_00937 [Gaeumannomyces tritici R3-111a-1]